MKIIRIENRKKKWKVRRPYEGLVLYKLIEKKFIRVKNY